MAIRTRDIFDDLTRRFFDPDWESPTWSGGYDVPTDIFSLDDKVVVRLDLAGVDPDDVELTTQQSSIVVNGRRDFPYAASKVRFLARGMFHGHFTKRINLGAGLKLDSVKARYDNGVLELTIPFREEVQPKRIQIESSGDKALTS
jgi:HSP20 family protein